MNALISEDNHTPDINEANTTNLDDIEIEALRLDISTWQKNSDSLWIVPEQHRLQVLRQCHDSIVAGHWGRDKTYELLTRQFTWDGCKEEVTAYVAGCIPCQKAKADRHA